MLRTCHIQFDNNILPKLVGTDSDVYFANLAKCLWDHFPQSRINEFQVALSAIITPSNVVEILDLPKTFSTKPNYSLDPVLRIKDFKDRCIQEHIEVISDVELDRKIKEWVSRLPRNGMDALVGHHFLDFCSDGRHAGLIREQLAIHKFLGFPYFDDEIIHPFLLSQSISAMNAGGFVPLLRLSRAIATALGDTAESRRNDWYNNRDIRLSPEADHLDTELLQVALFGAGPKQEHSAVCITNDSSKK